MLASISKMFQAPSTEKNFFEIGRFSECGAHVPDRRALDTPGQSNWVGAMYESEKVHVRSLNAVCTAAAVSERNTAATGCTVREAKF